MKKNVAVTVTLADGSTEDRDRFVHTAAIKPRVLPVYLQNLNRILPKGEILPVPMLGRVIFGRSFERHRDEPKSAFLSRARHALVELGVAS